MLENVFDIYPYGREGSGIPENPILVGARPQNLSLPRIRDPIFSRISQGHVKSVSERTHSFIHSYMDRKAVL